MKFRKAIERNHVTSADVTWKDLCEFGNQKGLISSVMEFLHSFWVGEHKERETSVRVGSVDVEFDKDGFLHLDFATRFRLNPEERSMFLEQLEQSRRRDARDWLEQLNKKGVQ